jgi:hypothetical protein
MNSPTKRLLNPERRRQVPAYFSWLDLVTVADACGLSYYRWQRVGEDPE